MKGLTVNSEIDVEKSASHQLSQNETVADNSELNGRFQEWRPAGSGIRYGRNVSVEGVPLAYNLADSSGFAGRCVQPKSSFGKVGTYLPLSSVW
jgi:hypothetical protein